MRREGKRSKENRRKGKGRDEKQSETQTHTWWDKQGTNEQGNNSEREQQTTFVPSLYFKSPKINKPKKNRLAKH